MLVVAPLPTLALLVGAGRGRFGPFLGALLVGLALWSSATYYLGEALARWTDCSRPPSTKICSKARCSSSAWWRCSRPSRTFYVAAELAANGWTDVVRGC